jgi:hypothetical protein
LPTKNISNQKYNRLTAIKFSHRNKYYREVWVFRCECGIEKLIELYPVKKGITKSCGCYNIGIITTHGQTYHPLFQTWINLKSRCYNENHKSYKYYGGRGITMSDEWKNSFFAFKNDIGERPSKKHSIDRIDNYKGYFPDNCRWVTMSEQCRNKRKTVFFEYNGEKKNLNDICDDLKLSHNMVYNRINKLGWNLEKALITPRNSRKIMILDKKDR